MNKNNNNNINNNNNKITRRKRKKNRRQIRRRRKILGRRILRRRLPMAYAPSFQRRFRMKAQNGTSVRVAGRDLIYQIPETINTNQTTVLTVIPCNPAYWLGTRVAALAAGYQNYRPIKFKAHYIPQCAVTQQGNVLAGTLWAMSPNKENLQQTLRTSNGGMLTQCYKQATSNVKLGANLQYNLYRMGGKFDQESNPFTFIAIAIAVVNDNKKVNPGYFSVEYEYEFKNPIGNTIQYYNSGLIQRQHYDGAYQNQTCINCSATTANIGATLQLDNDKYYYNDNEVVIEDTDELWYFSNDLVPSLTKAAPLQTIRAIYKLVDAASIDLLADTSIQWIVATGDNAYAMYFIYNYGDHTITFSLNNQAGPDDFYDVYVLHLRDDAVPVIYDNFLLTNSYETGTYSYQMHVFNYQSQLRLEVINKKRKPITTHKDVMYEDQRYQRKANLDDSFDEDEDDEDSDEHSCAFKYRGSDDDEDEKEPPQQTNINTLKATQHPIAKSDVTPFTDH